MRKRGWRQILSFARRNTQRGDASAHVLRAEALINPMDRLASMAHKTHRLRLADVRAAQARDDRDARAMEAEMPQPDFAEKARPVARFLHRHFVRSRTALGFKPRNQGNQRVVQLGRESPPAFRVEGDFHALQVDSRKRKAGFGEPAALVDRNFKADLHPLGAGFERLADGHNLRIHDLWLFSRRPLRDTKPEKGVRDCQTPANRFGRQEAEKFDLPNGGDARSPIKPDDARFLPPFDIVGRVLVGKLGWVANLALFKIHSQRFPRAKVAALTVAPCLGCE